MLITLIILEVIFVLVLIYFFRKLMIKNLKNITSHLEELNKDYTKKEEEANRLLEEAKKKADLILQEALNKAEELKNKIIKEAEEKKEDILNKAKDDSALIINEAQRAREKLLLEIEERISKEAFNKAYQILKDILPDNFKKAIHKEWIDELIKEEFIYIDNIYIPEDLNEVKIKTAFELSKDIKETLIKKIEDKLNRRLSMTEEIVPDLIAGIVINIGSFVIDASFKNKILKKISNLNA